MQSVGCFFCIVLKIQFINKKIIKGSVFYKTYKTGGQNPPKKRRPIAMKILDWHTPCWRCVCVPKVSVGEGVCELDVKDGDGV